MPDTDESNKPDGASNEIDEETKTKINQLGVYLLFFLMLLTLIPVLTYFSRYDDTLIRTFIYIGSSGGIGGIIYCIRGYYKHRIARDFTLNWTWWYIFRPFISVVAGVFVYFFIKGGLLAMGVTPEIDYTRNIMFYCAIAFLAGFSFSEFADKLYELSTTIFSKKKKDSDEEGT